VSLSLPESGEQSVNRGGGRYHVTSRNIDTAPDSGKRRKEENRRRHNKMSQGDLGEGMVSSMLWWSAGDVELVGQTKNSQT